MTQAYRELPAAERGALDRHIDIIAAILTVACWGSHPDPSHDDVLQAWHDFRDVVGNAIISEL